MISHKWKDNKCICGCERRGKGGMTRHSKDDFATYEVYIECTRPSEDKRRSIVIIALREKYAKKSKPVKDNAIPTMYYNINHVKELLGVKESAIRYWDNHFNLNIKQNQNGVRYFTAKDIDKLEKIKELRFVKKLEVEAAKEELKKLVNI